MPKKTTPSTRSMNALKTGAYARETLLPWESPVAYEKLRAAIFADLRPCGALETEIASSIAENRWLRERLRRMTAISNHRHPFGRALAESAPRSWSDALEKVNRHGLAQQKAIDSIAASISKIAQSAGNWSRSGHEELEATVASACEAAAAELARINVSLAAEREFFREFSPKQVEKRIRLENSLDAQMDKLLARFVVVREARALREKSGTDESSGDSVDPAVLPVSAEAGTGGGLSAADLAEMDREDVEEDVEELEELATADAPPEPSSRMRREEAIDPVDEFLAEDREESQHKDEGNRGWGLPKEPKPSASVPRKHEAVDPLREYLGEDREESTPDDGSDDWEIPKEPDL